VLLETYANRVAEAVESELGQVDPSAGRPLFLFATDPLLDLDRGIDHKRQVVVIPGAPDELRPDQIDSALRESLSALNAQRNNELVAEIGNDVSRGLVATDVTDTAPAPWSPERCRLWCTTSPLTSSVTSTARPARRSVALMKARPFGRQKRSPRRFEFCSRVGGGATAGVRRLPSLSRCGRGPG
jgi:hypothetical protein